MVIGQFTDSFYPIVDGVGRVVLNYANQIAAKGHESYVIAPMVSTGYRGGFAFDLVDYVGSPVPGSPQYSAGLAVLDKHYYERINDVRFDVVHAHTPFFSGQEAIRISKKQGVPLVATFHSKYYDDFYKATKAELLAQIGVKYVVEFYDRCDEVWAVSSSAAEVLRGYGFRGTINVMENGAEIRPRRAEDLELAKEKFGLSGDGTVFLYVGQLNWKKNILRILEACAILRKEGMEFKLALVGQGPDEAEIREKADELGLGGATVFTGHILDTALLDGLYQRASLFVFPSIYDTSALVVREAALMGTPSIVAKNSCASEVIRENVNGFITKDDSNELAEVIQRALSDKDKLAAVGAEAQATIPIGWDFILDKAIERYCGLVERSKYERLRSKTLLRPVNKIRSKDYDVPLKGGKWL